MTTPISTDDVRKIGAVAAGAGGGRYLVAGAAAGRIVAALAGRGMESQPAAVRPPSEFAAAGWDGVVFAGALERPPFEAALEILDSLAAWAKLHPRRLLVVTAGARKILPEDKVDAAQAAVYEYARSVGATVVDLGTSWEESLPGLATEISSGAQVLETGWRGDARHVLAPQETTGGRLQLHIPERGSLDNIELLPASRRTPGPGQIEIETELTAISFRDVLNVLGMYPGDPGRPGGECAGRVVAVGSGVTEFQPGDAVVAVAGGAHDGYVLADAYMAAHLPPELDLADALSLPSSFLTAVFSLEHLAGIRTGHRVLIHAGTGGVGLAAIQIAQKAGAEVFATAGSEEKREYLRSLGVPHTMSSRTPEFAEYIRRHTDGRGVDIVLNSLANEMLTASFESIASGGVFLEIGKNGIWSQKQVEQLDKRIAYHVIDWSNDAREHPELFRRLIARIMEDAAGGKLRPLPTTVFPFHQAREAFRLIARAKHTGRVLLRQTPDEEIAVHADATYVVAMDLRSDGLRAVQWLADRGARSLLLLDRTPPPPEALALIRRLARQGVRAVPGRTAEAGRHVAADRGIRGVLVAGGSAVTEHLQALYAAVAGEPLDFFSIVVPDAGDTFGRALAKGVAAALRTRGVRCVRASADF